MGIAISNGKILLSGGKLAIDPACCCDVDCCGGDVVADYPTLYLHLTNVSDCACLDGICIELTYDAFNGYWSGTGPGGGGCDATNVEWQFSCISNPGAGADVCLNFRLSISSAGVVCVWGGAFPDSCNCPPNPSWTFTVLLSGVGCCDADPGTLTAVVDDIPC